MILIAVAAVVVLVLIFGRDVNNAAHGSKATRASENRTFSVMANTLLTQQNDFDAHLAYLLSQGGSLTRPIFAARLQQLANELPTWWSEAELLRTPTLSPAINVTLANETEQRINADKAMVASVAASLTLPWPVTTIPVRDWQGSLTATTQAWNNERGALRHQPGRARLVALSDQAATSYDTAMAALEKSPTLRMVRGVGIAAVSVRPAVLPSATGELLLPPASSVQVGISVTNTCYCNQPITLSETFTPQRPGAPVQSQTMTATLGPLRSFAFVPKALATWAGEHGTLNLVLSGAPAGANLATTKTYRVVLSPSGN